jgi:hypothetical protein
MALMTNIQKTSNHRTRLDLLADAWSIQVSMYIRTMSGCEHEKPESGTTGLFFFLAIKDTQRLPIILRQPAVLAALLAGFVVISAFAQNPVPGTPAASSKSATDESEHDRAEREIKAQEKQRILGMVPEFNISNIQNAARLTPRQKFELAFKSAIDPFTVLMAGIDAGLDQEQDEFPGYDQGLKGYGRRFGASYADTFDSAMLGNALFPVLLHQDPRYFRKGTGSFLTRLSYAIATTAVCKGDSGKWQPNVSNLLGNLAAGGVATLYYPDTDRGTSLVFERAATVTAEGAIGAIFYEFWPDISRHFFHKSQKH